ncbi:hypothetical protein GMRT_10616 [Giardia muris]|uniref:Uncharacterized protein n=1 Tax=Giardia muris TaxID=5742 RepID=A0A4Z1SPL5_GIAMU|nr:hypothetical protein GMRT_10616 [Giardia muris]|eukprot:TNJ26805.1 hypothetical protein GMRT_10616 [Giardia muris]
MNPCDRPRPASVAIIYPGVPRASRRLRNHVDCYLERGFHVDVLGLYRGSLPSWLRHEGQLSYYYVDTAFPSPAPDSYLFWLIFPFQLVFDYLYAIVYLSLFCRGRSSAITVFAAPLRPGLISGSRFMAKLLGVPFWIDIGGPSQSRQYSGLRRRVIARYERRVLRPRGRRELALLASDVLVAQYNVSHRYIVLPSTPATKGLVCRNLQPIQHHSLLSRLRFAQPEKTFIGVRTVFHYAIPGPEQKVLLKLNDARPALVVCPCGFAGADDYSAIFAFIDALKDILQHNKRAGFTSAIVVITGRCDPWGNPQTRKEHNRLIQLIRDYNAGKHKRSEAPVMDPDYDSEEKVAARRKEKVAEYRKRVVIAKERGGEGLNSGKTKRGEDEQIGAGVRVHKAYLYDHDYFALLDVADLVFVGRRHEEASSYRGIPTSLIDAIISHKFVFHSCGLDGSMALGTNEFLDDILNCTFDVNAPDSTETLSTLLGYRKHLTEAGSTTPSLVKEVMERLADASASVLRQGFARVFDESILPQVGGQEEEEELE